MDPVEYRNRTSELLTSALKLNPGVLAIFEGGSAATNRLDEYSDLDFCLVVKDSPDTFIDLALEAVGESKCSVWRHSKTKNQPNAVVRIDGAPRFFLLDVNVFIFDSDEFREIMISARHGNMKICHDPEKIIAPRPISQGFAEKVEARRLEILKCLPIYETIIEKELLRGRALDAMGFYQSGYVRLTIELINIKLRPYQFDFGPRYLEEVLSPELRAEVASILFVKGPDEIKYVIEKCKSIIGDLYTATIKIGANWK